jgi:oxygen-independent coproporphyrinogen-3 oxidase
MSLPLTTREDREGAAPGAGDLSAAASVVSRLQWHPGCTAAIEPMISRALRMRPEGAELRYAQVLDGLASRPDDPVSLSMKVPFCTTRCMCCHRDIRAAQPSAVIEDYVSGLVDEIRVVADRIGAERDVLQFHLGGGTANELSERQLVRLVGALHRQWRLPADAEMSVECDPRRAGWAQLRALRGLGFSRVTFGVLDLDTDVQQAIGRRHSVALIDDVCSLARDCGVEYINLDLMVGLPYQTEQRWQTTLERVLAMAPDRVRLARYRHWPWNAPAQQAIDADALPGAEQTQALARQTADMLCSAGYRWIGADQFVLETDELALALEQGRLRRSLISYTATPPTPLLGLGLAAVGDIDGSLYWNESSLPVWRRAVQQGRFPVAHAQVATAGESKRRTAVDQLLCGQELRAETVRDGMEDAYHRLAQHESGGLVRVLEDRIVVTEAGRHELLSLCRELDEPQGVDGERTPRWLS